MFGYSKSLAILAGLFLAACSGGSKMDRNASAESPMAEQTAEQTTTQETSAADSKSSLAACTGGNVPQGATNCLLDLGTGEDTYWADTDGVDPGVAGCHDEYATDACAEVVGDRAFGEFCLDDDRLVESNPGKDECHAHGDDMGKPDVVSCSAWCESESGSAGRCEGGVMAQGAAGTCESARCVCDASG